MTDQTNHTKNQLKSLKSIHPEPFGYTQERLAKGERKSRAEARHSAMDWRNPVPWMAGF